MPDAIRGRRRLSSARPPDRGRRPSLPGRPARLDLHGGFSRLLSVAIPSLGLLFLLLFLACGAQASSHPDSPWSFQPLGPEGADAADIRSLGAGRWAARTADGELYLWEPAGGAAGGGWELLAVPGAQGQAGAVLSMARSGSDLLLLTSDGVLFEVDPAEAIRGASLASHVRVRIPSCAEGPSVERLLPSGFRKLGTVSCSAARACVALLPGPSRDANGPVSLITREGEVFEIALSNSRAWRIAFEPGAESSEAGYALRGAWRSPHGTLFLLTEWEGLYASLDGGHLAFPVENGLPKETRTIVPVPDSSGLWYAATADRVFQSADGAQSWQLCGRLAPVEEESADEVRALACLSGGRILLAVTRAGLLLRSADRGASWERRLSEEPARFRALATDGEQVRLASSRGILSADDGGLSWRYENRGLRRVSVESIRLVSLPGAEEGAGSTGWESSGKAEAAAILLGTGLGAYALREGGGAFECEPAGAWADSLLAAQTALQAPFDELGAARALDGKRILEWALAPLGHDWLFARAADGVYASRDRGHSWEALPVPAPLSVTSMAIDLVHRRLLLGTYRFGLFAAQLPEEDRILAALEPVHASPNPFGETVVLRCVLSPENAEAIAAGKRGSGGANPNTTAGAPPGGASLEGGAYLLVLSVHGQLIRKLPAPLPVIGTGGEQSLIWHWDGRDERGQPVANGLYLVTATAGTQRFSGKLIKLQ
ncbi:MAG: hypothetical protein KBD56_07465 [Candidatus Eisenbacteria bacterium]|nr:hypothetical protein [Candidatus Eisenbacteria bacterium]